MSKRTERRLKWGFFGLFAVIVVVIAGLYLAPDFRLRLAQQLGIVPGADAKQLAGPGEGRLIIISYPEQVQLSTPNYRQVARFIVRSGNQVTDLATGQTFTLPINDVQSVLISPDRSRLLLQGSSQSAVIDLSNDKTSLQQGAPDKSWGKAFIRPDLCSGVSPNDVYTLCERVGGEHNTRYLFGDWQVMVRPYGQTVPWQAVMRGRGSAPVAGFAPDNKSVYIYNELGIWQAPIK